MTIFGKFFMCKNGFGLMTLILFQKLTASPVATHTKSGMPHRSKGSKEGRHKKIGHDKKSRPKKNRARKNENFKIMF